MLQKAATAADKTQALIQKKEQYVANGISALYPMIIDSAKGAEVKDLNGNRYLDFYAGIGVVNAGHCPETVVASIKEQADKLLHSCFMVGMYESYINLAEKLCQIAPGSSPKKAMFVNSGAEAVENAVKIAKAYTKRQGIISFEGAFHGRTLMTMSLTSKVKPYKHEFGPFAPETYKVPYPNAYRSQLHVAAEDTCQAHLDYFERFFVSEVAPESIAAIIIEPVQGEGGFIVPPQGFLPGLKQICEKYGILLIADEVQSGFARTGKMFACEHFDLEPDLMTMAKGIGSGMPLSAVVGKAEIMDAPGGGRIGGTYGGNPVACAAALATIELMEQENLPDRAEKIGATIKATMGQLQQHFPQIGDIRGLGAMVAIELVKDPQTKEPYKDAVTAIIQECFKRGVLCMNAGIFGNVIRFLPPTVMTDEQLAQGMNAFSEAVAVVLGDK